MGEGGRAGNGHNQANVRKELTKITSSVSKTALLKDETKHTSGYSSGTVLTISCVTILRAIQNKRAFE